MQYSISLGLSDLSTGVVCVGIDGIESVSFAAKLLAVNFVARDTLPDYSKPLLSDTIVDELTHAVSLNVTQSTALC